MGERRAFVAGEQLRAGDMVAVGSDGKVYRAREDEPEFDPTVEEIERAARFMVAMRRFNEAWSGVRRGEADDEAAEEVEEEPVRPTELP